MQSVRIRRLPNAAPAVRRRCSARVLLRTYMIVKNLNIQTQLPDIIHHCRKQAKGFWGFGEIGRASCRERVYTSV